MHGNHGSPREWKIQASITISVGEEPQAEFYPGWEPRNSSKKRIAAMSFFDQPYYALTKVQLSGLGLWPEQSKYERVIRPLTAFALPMTLIIPRLCQWNDFWGDTASLTHDIPLIMAGMAMFVIVLRCMQHCDEIKLSFESVERHWEMFKNTPAVVVLDKYAKRGRSVVLAYSMYMYIEVFLYWALCLSPVILDVIDPLNETRSKIYVFQTEYGIDRDKYYWFIVAHEYIVMMVVISSTVAVQSAFLTWIVHACALFEVVGFNLKLVTNKHPANTENDITRCNDRNYKEISDCITAHEVAISFAELIETISNGPFATALAFLSIMIVFTGVQALINVKHHNVLIQSAAYIIGQVLNLYIISIPGQELINHSEKIHTIAYDLDWHDMSVKTQKLLIPILIRSKKPCRLTARKVYIISMESFGLTIRTVLSYFMIFAQMIQ